MNRELQSVMRSFGMDTDAWVKKWMESIKDNPAMSQNRQEMYDWFGNALIVGYTAGVEAGAQFVKEYLTESFPLPNDLLSPIGR